MGHHGPDAGDQPMTGEHGKIAGERYEIVVRHRLGETLRSAFPELVADQRGDDTVLAGTLADQAALYGVLARIEGLGLELLEVRRVAPGRNGSQDGDGPRPGARD